jgi:asparagine N-glycosylation enzyme membrane subunit Stt3
MWILPLCASAIALVFAVLLVRAFARRRRPFDACWALAMLMYAVASAMMALGVQGGWTSGEFRTYWLLGAVLNVPFLAAGQVLLLFRRRWVLPLVVVVLAFVTAYALAVVRSADLSQVALARDLPSGKEVFGDGTPAHRLPQLIAIPAYLMLVGGTIWSASRMRRTPRRGTASSASLRSPGGRP